MQEPLVDISGGLHYKLFKVFVYLARQEACIEQARQKLVRKPGFNPKRLFEHICQRDKKISAQRLFDFCKGFRVTP